MKDGGPVFPCPMSELGRSQALAFGFPADGNTGMSLRDYFAAKAMQGLCADPNVEYTDEIARQAYEIADAMLAEREKE